MKRLLYIALAAACVSCNSWIDGAKPKAFTEEQDLFSRESGFKEALTGTYQLAAMQNLYGRTLTFDYLDKLAQRYRYVTGTGTATFQQPEFYEMGSDTNRATATRIWNTAYTVIANINNLLGWLETNRGVLVTPDYHEIMRGEALALRSYIYFDLLRLFGPVPLHNPQGLSIVYRTELNRDVKDVVPADQMLDNITADLEQAFTLLKDTDPLDFEYVDKAGAYNGEDPFLVFRQNRMNAMAVRALLARVKLWEGDKTAAAGYAREVIESGHFALTRDNSQDHILSSEIIFGVHVHNMQLDITDQMINTSQWVVADQSFFENLMNVAVDTNNDMRVRNGFETSSVSGGTIYTPRHFEQTELAPSMLGMMPLLRLSEMYLIMAECTGEAGWLNQVRDARGILPVAEFADAEECRVALEVEYRKDFYCEGQLWYFYKRTAATSAQFFNMSGIVPTLTDRHYTFIIPDNEYQFGGISKEEE